MLQLHVCHVEVVLAAADAESEDGATAGDVVESRNLLGQYGRLPQWCCIAWLNGPIMNPDADGSHLFVIWYAGSLPNDLLSEAVKQIEGFQWEKLAADYWI